VLAKIRESFTWICSNWIAQSKGLLMRHLIFLLKRRLEKNVRIARIGVILSTGVVDHLLEASIVHSAQNLQIMRVEVFLESIQGSRVLNTMWSNYLGGRSNHQPYGCPRV
jgi:hypothetical protein